MEILHLLSLTRPSKTDGVTPFTFNMYFSLQGKGVLNRGNYPCPSSPAVVRLPSMSDVTEETLTSEVALETDITEQQQAAMQQEERVWLSRLRICRKRSSRQKASNCVTCFHFLPPVLCLFFLIVSQTLHQGTGDVEMTGTCCLYSGSSMKVVTSGKDARELEDLKLLQWRFSKGWLDEVGQS